MKDTKLTLEQHKELAGHLQYRIDSLNIRTPAAECNSVKASIGGLRITLQAQLLEDYPNAGNLYY